MPHWWYRGIRIPDDNELNPVKIVGREEWGAAPPTETKFLKKPIRTLVFAFNTEMDTCVNKDECTAAMKEMQTRHMDLGYPDIYYNFAVGGDGRVYEGRGWDAWHSANYSVYYGRTLVVGIIGQGRGTSLLYLRMSPIVKSKVPIHSMVLHLTRILWEDEEGNFFHAYGSGAIKLFRDAEENHNFPYFEKDKMVYEMHEKIRPYDRSRTKEIDLVPYKEEVPLEAEGKPCGLISSDEYSSGSMEDLLNKDLTKWF